MYDFLKNSLTILLAAALTSGTALAEIAPTFVGSATCANCHQQETADWKGSFHERAMAEASPATVLGNFGDATFTYNGIVSKFYRRGDEFFVRTDGPDGKLQEYKIDYTFGVFPLQQYLVKFPDGKMQALSISWDARAAKDGGQRWFHLYENERVDYKDVLHWTKLGQNMELHVCRVPLYKPSEELRSGEESFSYHLVRGQCWLRSLPWSWLATSDMGWKEGS